MVRVHVTYFNQSGAVIHETKKIEKIAAKIARTSSPGFKKLRGPE